MQKLALTTLTLLLFACSALAEVPEPIEQERPAAAPSIDGSSLYGTYCASCHGTLANTRIPDRRSGRIASAIRHFGSMAKLRHLSALEIIAIANVLKSEENPLAQR